MKVLVVFLLGLVVLMIALQLRHEDMLIEIGTKHNTVKLKLQEHLGEK